MLSLFLSPHNDDETLFGAFTLQREKPLVVMVTDSYVQWHRGDGITADQRWNESLEACRILQVPVMRLGVPDTHLTVDLLAHRLAAMFPRDCKVYAPALQGGHPHHDVVHRAALRVFEDLTFYCTYSLESPSYANTGDIAVVGTAEERSVKHDALLCYPSQMKRSRHHFEAVRDQPEWLS